MVIHFAGVHIRQTVRRMTASGWWVFIAAPVGTIAQMRQHVTSAVDGRSIFTARVVCERLGGFADLFSMHRRTIVRVSRI